jgi:hypothetical protein
LSNLQTYKPTGPLSGGARFLRGFTRIGTVTAVLVALIGIPISIMGGVNNYNYAVETRERAQCIAAVAHSGYTFKKKYEFSSELDYDVGGCSGGYRFSYWSVNQVIALANTPAPTFLTSEGASVLGSGLMITGLVAVAVYVGFWVIGWLCAGFTRDPPLKP